ncbi:MAG TPA: hypothetical protein PLQ04_04430 [Lachnospiraceae bacterium]|nr:hypothetical protein [Lachnospiraceae bacterium]
MNKCGLKTISVVVLSCLMISAVGGCSRNNPDVQDLTNEMREELGFNSDPVTTSDILVETSDTSIFTADANITSNYGDVYVLSYDSVEAASEARNYYIEKGASISDFSGVATIADGEPVGETDYVDSISVLNSIEIPEDVDFSEYIALIDTGADTEYEFSVIGEDTSDNNGHGNAMLGYILEENPDANVVSIKVSENGTATAADIYAGFELARTLGVSTVSFSMTAPDIEKNAIIKTIIQNTIADEITVIGAAGNYNINSVHFIPGCIEDVIVVGAANQDSTKYATSNYGADYYVVATSSSEATARYSGMWVLDGGISAISEFRLFDSIGESAYAYAYDICDGLNEQLIADGVQMAYQVVINDDGSVVLESIPLMDDFSTAWGPNSAAATWATTQYSIAPCAPGTYFGQCVVTKVSEHGGYAGYASGFNFADVVGHSGGPRNFADWANQLPYSRIPIVCSGAWESEDDSEHYASAGAVSGICNYMAIVGNDGIVNFYVTAPDRDPAQNAKQAYHHITNYRAVITAFGPMDSRTFHCRVWNADTGTVDWTCEVGPYDMDETPVQTAYNAIYSKVSGHYSGKVSLGLIGPGDNTFTIEGFGSQRFRGDLYTGSITPPPEEEGGDAENHTYHAAVGKKILTSELNDLVAAYGQDYVYNSMTFEARVNQDCIIVTNAGADGVYGLGPGEDGVYGNRYYRNDAGTIVGPDGIANTTDDYEQYNDDINDDSYYSAGAGTAIWSGTLAGMTAHTEGEWTIFQSPTFPTDGVFAVMASDSSYSTADITVTLTETGAFDAVYPG